VPLPLHLHDEEHMKVQQQVRTLTSGPKHHLFGYYSICPWNHSQTQLVCLESDFQDHLPEAHESAGIGLVDAQTGKFERITETRAWNLQQGTMLHWLPQNPDTESIHNDRSPDNPGDIISTIVNIKTGHKRHLPRAISGLSHNGRYALSLTYGRLQRMRKVVGYSGAVDPNPDSAHPDNDGIFLMDLETGEAKLIVSIKQIFEMLVGRHPVLRERHMWFNHVAFNPSDTRFFFLARCWEEGQLQTGMYTANLDGSDIYEVVPFGKSVSHFDWRNDTDVLVTYNVRGRGKEYALHTDRTPNYRIIGEGQLHSDGHPTFAPDPQWLVTDKNVTNPPEKWLLVYHVEDDDLQLLHRFPMFEQHFVHGDLRCDLHPRWNRTGDAVCVDALAADGTRQLHVVDLKLER
jgi:hypothetical protein